jgi:hypothetical protein
LFNAVSSKRLETVKFLSIHGKIRLDIDGQKALKIACKNSDLAMVEYFLTDPRIHPNQSGQNKCFTLVLYENLMMTESTSRDQINNESMILKVNQSKAVFELLLKDPRVFLSKEQILSFLFPK